MHIIEHKMRQTATFWNQPLDGITTGIYHDAFNRPWSLNCLLTHSVINGALFAVLYTYVFMKSLILNMSANRLASESTRIHCIPVHSIIRS